MCLTLILIPGDTCPTRAGASFRPLCVGAVGHTVGHSLSLPLLGRRVSVVSGTCPSPKVPSADGSGRAFLVHLFPPGRFPWSSVLVSYPQGRVPVPEGFPTGRYAVVVSLGRGTDEDRSLVQEVYEGHFDVSARRKDLIGVVHN